MATQTQRPSTAPPSARTSGWLKFAAIYLALAGAMNLIWGISALSNKDYFHEEGLIFNGLQFWGWIAIIVAAVQILTAWFIWSHKVAGMIMGITVAMIATLVNFLSIAAYPVWSIAAIVCSFLVLYAVTVHWEEDL